MQSVSAMRIHYTVVRRSCTLAPKGIKSSKTTKLNIFVETSLKVNSVLEREPNQLIATSILSNKYQVCFGMINKTIKIRTNQFIFTKSEKI